MRVSSDRLGRVGIGGLRGRWLSRDRVLRVYGGGGGWVCGDWLGCGVRLRWGELVGMEENSKKIRLLKEEKECTMIDSVFHSLAKRME